ncbi:MAG: alpha/beta hydrolase [Candidatus Omnitrophica bacterium]|nr:alpha/beta hydrolase [Candidatus Omnitrophota bacterium]
MRRFFLALFIFFSASGCAAINQSSDRGYPAEKIASSYGFEKFYIHAGQFRLAAFGRFGKPAESVTIYIEGDGHAWQTRSLVSLDPTPLDPLVLLLAVKDDSSNVVYLARPGQYPVSLKPDCGNEYWAAKRFAPEVIDSMNQAVSQIKQSSGAEKIELIGYSGGAAIAVLIAAQRQDVSSLRTIAGNLDHEAISRFHRVDLLAGSLNPIDYASNISNIPQRHFAAENDKIVPLVILQSFVEREGDIDHKSLSVVKGTTHDSGWEKKWSELISLPFFGG